MFGRPVYMIYLLYIRVRYIGLRETVCSLQPTLHFEELHHREATRDYLEKEMLATITSCQKCLVEQRKAQTTEAAHRQMCQDLGFDLYYF